MSEPECAICGRPTDAPVCHPDALSASQALAGAAGHAEDAETVIARQTHYGSAHPGRPGEVQPDADGVLEVNRRNPLMAFAWQASIERPKRGALRPGKIPPDLAAADAYDDIANTITTWARHICETRGVELPARRPLLGPLCDQGYDCPHPSCAGVRFRKPPAAVGEAALWLATQAEWLRHRPEAAEAFDELTDACSRLARLVDRPGAGEQLVGMCDCGKILYAPHGRTHVVCPEPTCALRWNVNESRDILRTALRGKLFTAAEAGWFAAYWDERTSEQIRKLINKWSERGRLTVHGEIDGDPTFLFGDVIDRLAQSPRRAATREAAEMGA